MLNDEDAAYADEVVLKIERLEREIINTRRNMKCARVVGGILIVLLFSFGGSYLSRTEIYLAAIMIITIIGIKEHLHRNRIKQTRSRVVNSRMWAF